MANSFSRDNARGWRRREFNEPERASALIRWLAPRDASPLMKIKQHGLEPVPPLKPVRRKELQCLSLPNLDSINTNRGAGGGKIRTFGYVRSFDWQRPLFA